MPKIKLPTSLRSYAAGNANLDLEGKNVGDLLTALLTQHPELTDHIYTEDGQLSQFVNIYLGETHIKDLDGLKTPLQESDILKIIPSIAGGLQ